MFPTKKGTSNMLPKLIMVICFTAIAAVVTLGVLTYNIVAKQGEVPVSKSAETVRTAQVLDAVGKEITADNTIYDNIYINDISVGGLTTEEALNTLQDKLGNILADKRLTITYGDRAFEYSFEDFYEDLNLQKTVQEAYQYARLGTDSEREEKLNSLKGNPLKLYIEGSYDEAIVNARILQLSNEIDVAPVNADINRSGGVFTTTGESTGIKLNIEKTTENVIQQLEKNETGTVEAVVDIAYPQITLQDVENAKSLIGTFTTSLSGSMSHPRNVNILNACDKINNTKLMPGEIFSTNDLFGAMTYENGYREAATILDGAFVDGFGGGVCQVSSTLYNAVLFAELQVVERQNHSLKVGYLDYAFDAVLAGDYIDLKFKNSTDYPIFVESYVSNSKVIVNIYGYEEHSPQRRLEFKNTHISTTAPEEPIIKEDPSLAAGQVVVVKAAKSGQKYQLYKYIYEGNTLIDTVLMNTSTYRTVRGENKVGTGAATVAQKEENTETEVVTQTQENETYATEAPAVDNTTEVQPDPTPAETTPVETVDTTPVETTPTEEPVVNTPIEVTPEVPDETASEPEIIDFPVMP